MRPAGVFVLLFAAAWMGAIADARAQSTVSGPQAVAIFAGQSNEVSHGTLQSTYGFAGVPGGVGSGGINATAACYETSTTLSGATPGSGSLVCGAPTSGHIYAGQAISGLGVPPGQSVTSANNWGNFPGATGTGTNAGGTYVVTPAAAVGAAGAPVTMTFSEPISELGRRLYLAYTGKCDYHSPTC